jgi:hypothetical protein
VKLYENITCQAFGGLAGMFAWLSVQPWISLGWLYAGAIVASILRKAVLDKEKAHGMG